jgi:hypothetical protein
MIVVMSLILALKWVLIGAAEEGHEDGLEEKG